MGDGSDHRHGRSAPAVGRPGPERFAPGPGWFGNAYLLLPLAALCWGGNSVVGKLAADVMSPVTLTFFRWLFAAALIFAVGRRYLRSDWGRLGRAWRRVLLLGAFGFTAFNLTMYWALHYTSAINVSIEQAAMPVVIILGNFLLFGQRARTVQIAGVALTILGVLVTATRGDLGQLLEAAVNRGDLIMLVAVAIYGSYAIALRFKPAMHWMSLLFGMSIAALLAVAPLWAFEVATRGFPTLGLSGWAMVGFVVLFPSLMAQLFFMRGIELIGANRAGLFVNLVPIFGAGLAVVFLGEPMELYHAVGLALVLGGIMLAERFAPR